jgi:hypothetical protein
LSSRFRRMPDSTCPVRASRRIRNPPPR